MRPLPDVLTIDVLSALKNPDGTITGSADELMQRREDLAEIGRAQGFRDINYVTLKAMHPQDLLIGCIIAKVMQTLKIQNHKESIRGPLVYAEAKAIYDRISKAFIQITEKEGNVDRVLAQQIEATNHYIDGMCEREREKSWNRTAFVKRNPIHEVTYKSKANAVYADVMDHIFSNGEDRYVARQGWDSRRVVKEWIAHTIRYDYYVRVADELIDKELKSALYPSEQKITLVPVGEREGIKFVGGNGSGKTTMFETYITALLTAKVDPYDMAYHNTDFAVRAVWEFAKQDSHISPYLNQDHKGIQTHGAASDWAYRQLLLRSEQAKDGYAPNVAAGSVEINNDVIDDILLGGGKIEIHHLSVDQELAKKSCVNRPDASGRVPDDKVVERSVRNAANSLTRVTEASYRGSQIMTYIYERSEDKKIPQLDAVINCEKSEILIYDMEAFIRILGRSERERGYDYNSTIEKSAKAMIREILDNKFSLVSINRSGEELYRLDSEGKLTHKEGELGNVHDLVRGLNQSGIQERSEVKVIERHKEIVSRAFYGKE